MGNLTLWNAINKQWFAKRQGPSCQTWIEWIIKGEVLGKVIGGVPFVDADHFAANIAFNAPANDNGKDKKDLLG